MPHGDGLKCRNMIIVGNLTLDRIHTAKSVTSQTPGGGAFYAGTALAKLGAEVSLISGVGDDYPTEYIELLTEAHVNMDGVRRELPWHSTSFRLFYPEGGKEREIRLAAPGPPLRRLDIVDRIGRRDCVLVAPVANELTQEVLEALASSQAQCMAVDLHVLRTFAPDGTMRLDRGIDLGGLLRRTSILKGSLEEIRSLTGVGDIHQAIRTAAALGPDIVTATDGANGSLLLERGRLFKVPACEVVEQDSTGAGDVYLASLLYFRSAQAHDCTSAACLATAAASFAVEDRGVEALADVENVARRARGLKVESFLNEAPVSQPWQGVAPAPVTDRE